MRNFGSEYRRLRRGGLSPVLPCPSPYAVVDGVHGRRIDNNHAGPSKFLLEIYPTLTQRRKSRISETLYEVATKLTSRRLNVKFSAYLTVANRIDISSTTNFLSFPRLQKATIHLKLVIEKSVPAAVRKTPCLSETVPLFEYCSINANRSLNLVARQ